MVCKCSLVERLDLLPMAVLLMIGGKLPAKTGKIHSLGRAFTMVVNVLPSEQVLPSDMSTDTNLLEQTASHLGYQQRRM